MKRRIAPLVAAVLIAAAMIWLARGPFDDIREAGGRSDGFAVMTLREPVGTQVAFPRRFAWDPVDGATLYEISVGKAEAGELLFRQRGTVPGLDLTIDPQSMPPPGAYAWEVEAFRGSTRLAKGNARFDVLPPPQDGGAGP